MSNGEITPRDPANLAASLAPLIPQSKALDAGKDEIQMLSFLNYTAESLDFIDQTYFIEASQAFVIPDDLEAATREDGTIPLIRLPKLMCEGPFNHYAKVGIDHIVGVGTVRAWCLSFEEALLLPTFEQVPDDHTLYIPALAVDSINETA